MRCHGRSTAAMQSLWRPATMLEPSPGDATTMALESYKRCIPKTMRFAAYKANQRAPVLQPVSGAGERRRGAAPACYLEGWRLCEATKRRRAPARKLLPVRENDARRILSSTTRAGRHPTVAGTQIRWLARGRPKFSAGPPAPSTGLTIK